MIFVNVGAMLRRRVEVPSSEKKIFNIGIISKNTSKYGKLMVEPYFCDNLNQIYRFFPSLINSDVEDKVFPSVPSILHRQRFFGWL